MEGGGQRRACDQSIDRGGGGEITLVEPSQAAWHSSSSKVSIGFLSRLIMLGGGDKGV